MDIFINEKKCDFTPRFPLTWRDFFKKLLIDGEYIEKNHGVVKITVDGVDSIQLMAEQADKEVPGDIKRVDVFSLDNVTIARDGFNRMTNLIKSMEEEIPAAAALYREEKIQEASSVIVNIMEAFKPLVSFINSIGLTFSLDFATIRFKDNKSVQEKMEEFLESFSDMFAAQERKEYALLANYLETRFIEDLSDWLRIAEILQQEIKK